ncbi:glutathione-S-transferas-like protein omega 1 [Byssothecium circinans]|uniref:Glutathione-S-transferas-like protein omega 1 n=1 Tax=Byssothecium circinans TaxID=147558 RepID=A0A6A5TNT3_9PLEO|nr:glutathione-S-transferas-like protein omega 1 [Byssothecium circinans]
MAETPKITLYTNHGCPWAHRAHITIKELGLPYEEVIIDLKKPREPWYLEINPRGLVPSINYNGEIITESAVVSQFLADAHPSHLIPPTGNAKDALTRARIQFFVDTWFTKAGSYWYKIPTQDTEEQKEDLVKEFVSIVAKEIEPLLKDAKPFFGGSSKLTLAEALTAPFILRIYEYSKHGILPKSATGGLNALPNFARWAAEVIKHDSVTYVWDAETFIPVTKERFAKLKAEGK